MRHQQRYARFVAIAGFGLGLVWRRVPGLLSARRVPGAGLLVGLAGLAGCGRVVGDLPLR
jgi:hypothetical protein